jgi:hypothetical protein
MRWLRSLAVLVALSPLAGCKQGVGDRCQVQSDCADGLQCVLPASGSPQTGGTCQPPGGQDAGLPDLLPTMDISVAPDMTSTDGPSGD